MKAPFTGRHLSPTTVVEQTLAISGVHSLSPLPFDSPYILFAREDARIYQVRRIVEFRVIRLDQEASLLDDQNVDSLRPQRLCLRAPAEGDLVAGMVDVEDVDGGLGGRSCEVVGCGEENVFGRGGELAGLDGVRRVSELFGMACG